MSSPIDSYLAQLTADLLDGRRQERQRSLEMAEESRNKFSIFVRYAWPIMEPNRGLISGWHMDAICEHLQAAYQGQIKRLLITVPPGTAKSLITSVALPAWIWTKNPGYRSIFGSYDAGLSTRDSIRCRDLMNSMWYQETFQPSWKFSAVQNEKTFYTNTHKGFRIATSVGGKSLGTGWRGNLVAVDDPLSTKDEDSDKALDECVNWWDRVMFNRFDNMAEGIKIIIMQRISDRDLAGHVLRGGGYEHLMIPNEYEPDRSKVTSIGWRDPRKKRGELMCEALIPQVVTEDLKIDPGRYEGQYQQNPHPEGAGILKPHYWNYWKPRGLDMPKVRVRMPGGEIDERDAVDLPEEFDLIIQSWDCLDSETEILTKDGWRGRGTVSVSDLVFSLNTESGQLELVPVERYGERCLRENEKMTRIEGGMRDIRVTEGHKFFVETRFGKAHTLVPKWFTGRELASRNRLYRLPVSGNFEYPGVPLTDDELRFVAWFITDGGFANQYVQISQTKDYKYDIEDLLNRLGFDFVKRFVKSSSGFATTKIATKFLVPKGTKTGKYERNGWARLAPWLDKDITPALHLMTASQFSVFWKELLKGDGDIKTGYLCTARQKAANNLQHMAVTRGFSSSSHCRPSTTKGTPIWYVSAKPREWVESNPRVKGAARLTLEDGIPGEAVWCVQNSNSTLITRRNGKIAIVGNCAFKDLKDSDFVAGGVMGSRGPNRYLLDAVHDRMDITKTVDSVRQMSSGGWGARAHLKLIEDKANGPAVMQLLGDEIGGLIPVQPEGGKVSRARAASHEQRSGNWYLPHPLLRSWVGKPEAPSDGGGFLQECTAFPNGANDDYVDMFSQGAIRIKTEQQNGVFKSQERDIIIQPHEIPKNWLRVYGLCVTGEEIAAVWLAQDPETKGFECWGEYWAKHTDPVMHVKEIKDRGAWIPGVISAVAIGRDRADGYMLAEKYANFGLRLDATPDVHDTTAIVDINRSLAQGKLKIFSNLPRFFDQYRMYRRDSKGKFPTHNIGLMKALETVWQWGPERMRAEVEVPQHQKPIEVNRFQRDNGGGWMRS